MPEVPSGYYLKENIQNKTSKIEGFKTQNKIPKVERFKIQTMYRSRQMGTGQSINDYGIYSDENQSINDYGIQSDKNQEESLKKDLSLEELLSRSIQ